jgi:phosphoribosylformimino-5-aminoimidazole carboxamide ribotide isomerase
MRFRPCIDLHHGQVKQIVGSTLSDQSAVQPETNFVSGRPASYYAELYRRDQLTGGHVIMLGPGNEIAAKSALEAYPGGLQIGGGITAENAVSWLETGAAKVIVTSHVFRDGLIDWPRLRALVQLIGRDRLVLDLSCRRRQDEYLIVTDRWQKFTNVVVNEANLARLSACCAELLVHAVDVEGKQAGIDVELIRRLHAAQKVPITYAGGVRSLADMDLIDSLGDGQVDATVGSALDIFGGVLPYADVVAYDRIHRSE